MSRAGRFAAASPRRSVGFGADRTAVSSGAMEGARNYFRWQYDAIRSHLGARVLEAGCGESGFTEMLLGRECVVSVDLDPLVIENARRKLDGRPEWRGVIGDFTSPDLFAELSAYRFDSIAALNVVEHIEDDAGALRVLRRLLPAGGTAAVLVPAHQRLYGTLDAAAGHFRRYTRAEIAGGMSAAGFRVDDAFYFNAIGALGWWLNGRVLDKRHEDTVGQVRLFDRFVVPVARAIESLARPPFGISAIVLGTAE